MTVGQLADAAIRYSDNTAGNLLLRVLGGRHGPAALTGFLRAVGDDVTRLDRWETALGEATPGDPRDTSTPSALADTYERLLTGRVLVERDRWVLVGWLQSSTTSVTRFRAGLPSGWWCADKTGSGQYGVMNDVGLVTGPDGTEIVFAIQTRASATDPEAAGTPEVMEALARHLVGRLTDVGR
jgi:beta-lactamase class A